MPDDLDKMLEGEDQDSPSSSQLGNNGSGSNSDTANDGQGTEGQSEEVEFNQLTGSSQDRFRKIYNERQEAIRENQRLRSLITNQDAPTAPGTGNLNSEQQDAIKKLDSVGIATKDFVKSQIQDILSQKTYYDELDKLEGSLDGNDGRPKFAREEYFDYIERHPQFKNYLPVDVYEKMYKEELDNWRATNGNQRVTSKRTQTLRPTRTASRESDLSIDEIEAKLKSMPEPQRSQWYQSNLNKINEAVARAGKSQ